MSEYGVGGRIRNVGTITIGQAARKKRIAPPRRGGTAKAGGRPVWKRHGRPGLAARWGSAPISRKTFARPSAERGPKRLRHLRHKKLEATAPAHRSSAGGAQADFSFSSSTVVIRNRLGGYP